MASLHLPRIVVAGMSGGAGKTLVSLGLARALRNEGLQLAAFKKGPDYIDTAWLGAAAQCTARNLDSFLASEDATIRNLASALSADLAIIEGNRGLFDGMDAHGSFSTAELAKRLQAPTVLVVDASHATRTVAALVLGCLAMDPELPLAGIILNRVGTRRQEKLIRDALALKTSLPVLGAIPKIATDQLPSRQLGLVMPHERPEVESCLEYLASVVAASVDLPAICQLAAHAPGISIPSADAAERPRRQCTARIGLLKDAAFSFYYSENLAALEAEGATLVPISPLSDRVLPEIDALYAGGGYPEEYASALAENVPMRTALAARIEQGMPVWAECGGLMYLSREIVRDGVSYSMVGALPVSVEQTSRPQGHGYVEACVDSSNPFLTTGTRLRGHEFHYSRLSRQHVQVATALALGRGEGIGNGRDGIVRQRVFASYMHLFAPGVPEWAPAFVRAARAAQSSN